MGQQSGKCSGLLRFERRGLRRKSVRFRRPPKGFKLCAAKSQPVENAGFKVLCAAKWPDGHGHGLGHGVGDALG